jgi:Na+-transporting NADH:ubiquinone oxidoreductase subunit NqrC
MMELLYVSLDSIAYAALFTVTVSIICSIIVLGVAVCLKIASILLNKKGEKK